MSRILYTYQDVPYFRDHERLEDFDLRLMPGEVWLSTEPEKMTWLEAIEVAGWHSNIRLPHYQDLIHAAERAKEKILEDRFPDLEDGEFWTVGSEGYEANQPYACCLAKNHRQYESHHMKFEKKWVRFIKLGKPEADAQRIEKDQKRVKYLYEENLRDRAEKILGLDTPEGQRNLRTHLELMKGGGLGF